jgi:[ribosomal protein S5]-alanine N-acetyltransferase
METVLIHTRRLSLQSVHPNDLEAFAELWRDPNVMVYLPAGKPLSNMDAEQLLEYMLSHWQKYGFGTFTVRWSDRPDFLGYCGVQYLSAGFNGVLEGVQPVTELLYGYTPAYWGKGIATEAAAAVLRFSFETLDLPQVIAAIHPDNAASGRILEKMGMQRAEQIHYYGDCPHYRLSAEAYQPTLDPYDLIRKFI